MIVKVHFQVFIPWIELLNTSLVMFIIGSYYIQNLALFKWKNSCVTGEEVMFSREIL